MTGRNSSENRGAKTTRVIKLFEIGDLFLQRIKILAIDLTLALRSIYMFFFTHYDIPRGTIQMITGRSNNKPKRVNFYSLLIFETVI